MAIAETTPATTNRDDVNVVELLGDAIETLCSRAAGTELAADVDRVVVAWRDVQADVTRSRSAVDMARTLLTMAVGQTPVAPTN